MLLSLLASAAAFMLPVFPMRLAHQRTTTPAAKFEYDVNDAVTRLNAAVEREDYAAATAIKEEIDGALKANPLNEGGAPPALTWEGTPAWLGSRLETCGFRYPTPVQAVALRWSAEQSAADTARDDEDASLADDAAEASPETPADLQMEPMEPALEVMVPDGLVSGDILAVETEDGTVVNVMVPEGIGAGDTLLINLSGSDSDSPPQPSPPQRDAVISAPTGAGKTLAFTIPTLCEIASELENRSAERVAALTELLDSPAGADISPTDEIEALAAALQLPGGSADAAGSSKGVSIALPTRSPPVALIVTPTGSLAEQAARQIFALVGGRPPRSTNKKSKKAKAASKDGITDGQRAAAAQSYDGPKAVCVAALLTLEDGAAAAAAAEEGGTGALRECEVLVASVDALASVHAALDTSALAIVCIDEADACDCSLLGTLPETTRRVLIGATVGKAVATAVEEGWVAPPMLIDGSGAARRWDPTKDLAQALCPPGLTHRFSVAPESGDDNAVQLQLLALARLLRKDLREWEAVGAAAVAAPGPAFAAARGLAGDAPAAVAGPPQTRPRAVVFTQDAKEALRVGAALRDALWGEQAVATRGGATPEAGAAAFKALPTDNGSGDFASVIASGGASILVVPMSEGRGLDFPDVTHVYMLSLGLRAEDADEYAHMAGRAGRVGQAGRGVVTSVIASDPDWVNVFTNLNNIVQGALGRGLEAVAVPATSEEDVDVRRSLNDLILLTKDEEEEETTSA